MPLHFVDYHGPHGLFVATGDEIVSFESAKGALSLVSGSIQAGIGDTVSAAAVEAIVDKALALSAS